MNYELKSLEGFFQTTIENIFFYLKLPELPDQKIKCLKNHLNL